MKLVKCVNGTSNVYKLWLVWFVNVEMVYVCATAPASARWIGACIWVFQFVLKFSGAQKWRRLWRLLFEWKKKKLMKKTSSEKVILHAGVQKMNEK